MVVILAVLARRNLGCKENDQTPPITGGIATEGRYGPTHFEAGDDLGIVRRSTVRAHSLSGDRHRGSGP